MHYWNKYDLSRKHCLGFIIMSGILDELGNLSLGVLGNLWVQGKVGTRERGYIDLLTYTHPHPPNDHSHTLANDQLTPNMHYYILHTNASYCTHATIIVLNTSTCFSSSWCNSLCADFISLLTFINSSDGDPSDRAGWVIGDEVTCLVSRGTGVGDESSNVWAGML